MADVEKWDDFVGKIVPGSIADKILGMFYGHALGDAVGLITKFKFKKDDPEIVFPYSEQIRDFPICDWTDDTDHLLIVTQSLIENNFNINEADIANRLCNWMHCGIPELGDTRGIGLGGNMNLVMTHSKFLSDPQKASMEIWQSSGGRLAPNGSLMRTSVIGALPLAYNAHAVTLCKLTHSDPRCVASCVLHSLLLTGVIYGKQNAEKNAEQNAEKIDALLHAALKVAREHLIGAETKVQEAERAAAADNLRQPTPQMYKDAKFSSYDEEFVHWVNKSYTEPLQNLQLDAIGKIGFVLKCLGCSIYALRVIKVALQHKLKPSFKKIITTLAKECGDADTNCAVAGSLIGAHLGYSQLPKDWILALPNAQWMNNILMKFIKQLGTKLSTK